MKHTYKGIDVHKQTDTDTHTEGQTTLLQSEAIR